MYQFDPPAFPSFSRNEYFWGTSATLPAWVGYQIRNGPYCSVSEKGISDGKVHVIFAPEGRGDDPPSDHEIRLVKWVVENEASVHDAMLKRLFEEYPAMREEALDWFDEDEAKTVLPMIRTPDQLKKLVGISAIYVHPIEKDGKPFIGVELGCTWEVEHGLGVLLHGANVVEVGGADTAFTLWVARKHAGLS